MKCRYTTLFGDDASEWRVALSTKPVSEHGLTEMFVGLSWYRDTTAFQLHLHPWPGVVLIVTRVREAR